MFQIENINNIFFILDHFLFQVDILISTERWISDEIYKKKIFRKCATLMAKRGRNAMKNDELQGIFAWSMTSVSIFSRADIFFHRSIIPFKLFSPPFIIPFINSHVHSGIHGQDNSTAYAIIVLFNHLSAYLGAHKYHASAVNSHPFIPCIGVQIS